MLKDVAEKYVKQDYNCAESIILAANEYYHLNIKAEDVKLFSGFGAGMQIGNICGGLSSSIGVISLLFVKKQAHEDKVGLKAKTNLLIDNFNNKFNSLNCSAIKPQYYTSEKKCLRTIVLACDILEETIQQINNK